MKEQIQRSWWVLFFALLCLVGYERELKSHEARRNVLAVQLLNLKNKLAAAKELQTEYRMQIKSQNDPAWIELTLMKELGVVPEGQTKVIFSKPSIATPR